MYLRGSTAQPIGIIGLRHRSTTSQAGGTGDLARQLRRVCPFYTTAVGTSGLVSLDGAEREDLDERVRVDGDRVFCADDGCLAGNVRSALERAVSAGQR